MSQARTLTNEELALVLAHVDSKKHPERNRAIVLLTHYAGLRIGEVACLRWCDVVDVEGMVKDEIRLLPEMTKGRHARTVFVSKKLREELQTYVNKYKRVAPRDYPLFYSQKSVKQGFTPNSLSQTVKFLYAGAGISGASSHSGRRTFLTNLANRGTAIHLLKTLAGHRNISTTAAYLYTNPVQLKAAVELV